MTKEKDIIYVHSAAPRIKESRNFYKSINFHESWQDENQSVFSDATFDIFINGRPEARTGFLLFTDNVQDFVEMHSHLTFYDTGSGMVTADPNGVNLFVRSNSEKPEFKKSDLLEKSFLGNYYGAGIETVFFEDTLEFYQKLGYKPSAELSENSPYAMLTYDHGPAITLFRPGNCPHAFYNPSLTFFNGKTGNPKAIESLLNAGINPVENITVFNPDGEIDNIIVSDPGRLHCFIFNDG